MKIEQIINKIANTNVLLDNGCVVKMDKAHAKEILYLRLFVTRVNELIKVTTAYKALHDHVTTKEDGYYEIRSEWFEKGTFGYDLCRFIDKYKEYLNVN